MFLTLPKLHRRFMVGMAWMLASGMGGSTMAGVIAVSVAGSDRPTDFRGPVPVIVSVSNISPDPVKILLPYPNPNNLRLHALGDTAVRQKTVERKRSERTVPIELAAGETRVLNYYANRYFEFQGPGQVNVSYDLTIPVTVQSGGQPAYEDAAFEGRFLVKLVKGSEVELRADLAKFASQLENEDRQLKMEAAEALAFLDTPVSVDYVRRMLSISNLEVAGIRALARFPSPDTNALIVGMLSHRESGVVAAALAEMNRLQIQVPRQKIQELLSSGNANTRWLALEWLAARPDRGDLPLMAPVLHDQNVNIRERATAYADVLRPR